MRARIPLRRSDAVGRRRPRLVWRLAALTLLLALLPVPLLEAKGPPPRTEQAAPSPTPAHKSARSAAQRHGARSTRERQTAASGARRKGHGGHRRPPTAATATAAPTKAGKGHGKHQKTPTPAPTTPPTTAPTQTPRPTRTPAPTATATAIPTRTPTPIPTTTPPPTGGIDTVVLIVMENHDWSTIKGSSSAPYLNSLLSRPDAAYASNYHNVPPGSSLHPSEPNYLWLEGATNVYPDHTFTTDDSPSASNSTSSSQHLVALLQAKGIAWTSYMEDATGTGCPIGNAGNFTPRHNGILFFQDVVGNPPSTSNASCQQHVRPYGELAGDLNNDRVHGYNVLIPNLCHDMHSNSCAGSSDVIRQGDDWLAANLPTILTSKVYQGGHALVAITWDEGGSGNNPIGMILLSPQTQGNGYTNSIAYTHASWVKTVEQIFGLSPLVGHAADAGTADLGDLFKAGATTASATTKTKPHQRTQRPDQAGTRPRGTAPDHRSDQRPSRHRATK